MFNIVRNCFLQIEFQRLRVEALLCLGLEDLGDDLFLRSLERFFAELARLGDGTCKGHLLLYGMVHLGRLLDGIGVTWRVFLDGEGEGGNEL